MVRSNSFEITYDGAVRSDSDWLTRKALVSSLGVLAACGAPAKPVEPAAAPDAVPARVCRVSDWNSDAAKLPDFQLAGAHDDQRPALSPDRRWLATSESGGRLWEVSTGRLARTGLPGVVFCDADHVVGEERNEVVSLELSSGVRTTTPLLEGDLLSPDRCQLARSDEGLLRFFDTRTGREIDAQPSAKAKLFKSDLDILFEVTRGDKREAWTWAGRRRVDSVTLALELSRSADGRYVCELGFRGARAVDLETGEIVFERRTTGHGGEFSSGMQVPKVSLCGVARGGSLVAVVELRSGGFHGYQPGDYRISVFDRKGRNVAAFDRSGMLSVAFSDDSRSLRIETQADTTFASQRCERIDLASKQSTACGAELDALTIEKDGRVVVRVDEEAHTFDTACAYDALSLPTLPRAPEGPVRLAAVERGNQFTDLFELPSGRWRGTVPTARPVRWMGSQVIVFDDEPGKLVGYRLDDCSVLRVAGLRVGAQKTFVVAARGVLEADGLARMLFREEASPRRLEEGLVARFLAP